MTTSRFTLPLIATAGFVLSAGAVASELSAEQWVHVGNWTHDFTTGPGIAGIFAVVAASIAYTGIKQQVDKTAEANRNVAAANSETARKNRESQWWDTLKWTYNEAMATDTAKSGFRGVAAVRILESLNTDHDNLTVQQRDAVESILEMFAESNNPDVQEAADRVFASFGRTSPLDYEKAVEEMLRGLNLRNATVATLKPTEGADYEIRDGMDRVAVLTKTGQPSVRDINQISAILAREQSGPKPYKAGLLISERGVPVRTMQMLRGVEQPLSIVSWQPGKPPHEIEGVLNQLLHTRR